MNRRRLVLSISVITACVAALALLVFPRVEGTYIRLRHGEKLTFCATTVGSNTTYCFGNVLQRVAARIPGQLGAKLSGGTRAESWHYNNSNVVFWFLCEEGDRTVDRIHFRVVDERGIESDPYFDRVEAYSDGDTIGYYFQAGILPRRSRQIRLRVFEADKSGELLPTGEFQIPNPLCAKFPDWTAEALPATRRFGEMTVTLDDLRVTLDSNWTNTFGRVFQANVARMHLLVTESNQLTDDWVFFGARSTDATGDFSYDWYTTYQRLGPGDLQLTGRWPVWPGEKTVKLQTLWVRREAPPPERIVTFYDLPLPSTNPALTIIASTNHPLGELAISCRTVEGQFGNEWILELFSRDRRFYRYADPEVDCYFFQAARDEAKKELERIDFRQFRVHSGAKSVDVAIHLPKAKRVDFLVSPRLVSTNTASSKP